MTASKSVLASAAKEPIKDTTKHVIEKAVPTAGKNASKSTAEKIGKSTNEIFEQIDINKLSKAGSEIDREQLTRAGRALDKHGNCPGTSFPKAIGNQASKNQMGQFQLDDILTSPRSQIFKTRTGIEIYAPDGRGVYFYNDGRFRGFINITERKP